MALKMYQTPYKESEEKSKVKTLKSTQGKVLLFKNTQKSTCPKVQNSTTQVQ